MRSLRFCSALALILSTFKLFAQNGPGGVGTTDGASNLELWMKADVGTNTTLEGGAITNWADQSGNGNDMTPGLSPSFYNGVINGQPTIRFNYGEYLQSALTSSFTATGFSVFVVGSWDPAPDTDPGGYLGLKSDLGSFNGNVTFFIDDVNNNVSNQFRVSSESTGTLGGDLWATDTHVPNILSATRSTTDLMVWE